MWELTWVTLSTRSSQWTLRHPSPQCLKLLTKTSRAGTNQVCIIRRFDLSLMILKMFPAMKMATATTLSRHRISNHKENPTLAIALGHSSPYTPRLQRKRITRWSSAGKKTLTGSSFCESSYWHSHCFVHELEHYRPVYSLLRSLPSFP